MLAPLVMFCAALTGDVGWGKWLRVTDQSCWRFLRFKRPITKDVLGA